MLSASKSGSGLSTGYNLTRSLRFRSSASAYLSRTITTNGTSTTWTYSTWVKRGTLGAAQDGFLEARVDGSNNVEIRFNSNDTFYVVAFNSGSAVLELTTTQAFRDPSAWYHIIVAVDTTQATAANRAKIYVNGTQVTALSTATYPAQNTTTYMSQTSATHNIGRWPSPTQYYDGYIAETNFIDGQALTPSSFGSTNATTGVWQPAKYTGTYGTNGFYLPFSLSTASTYAGLFNGSNQNITAPANSNLSLTGNLTIEAWIYATTSTGTRSLVQSRSSSASGNGYAFGLNSSNQLYVYSASSFFGTSSALNSNQWNHVAWVRSGSTNTFYINGVASGTFSNSSSYTDPSTNITYVGGQGTEFFAGNISNVRINTTAVYTSNFVPSQQALTAISGTQLLTLQNATLVDNSSNALSLTNNNSVTFAAAYPFAGSNLGSDQSGNANNWTTNNISLTSGVTYDSMTDVPTLTSATAANYAVLNPLTGTSGTVSNGNLFYYGSGSWMSRNGTMVLPPSTKIYFEATVVVAPFTPRASNSGYNFIGVGLSTNFALTTSPNSTNVNACGIGDNGYVNNFASSSTDSGTTISLNNVIGIAIDTGANTYNFYVNNTSVASGTINVTAGTTLTPFITSYSNAYGNFAINFGQQPFTYTPPTGFVALNTYNLPTSTILQGNKVMDATSYTSNGGVQTVTNTAGFKLDFLLTKPRSNSGSWVATDSVRGVALGLNTNNTNAEFTDANYVTAFNSNGFSLGSTNWPNGYTMVGYQWQAGQGSTSSNTNGSITSTVSVNASAGFSVVTYTGTGANATVGHGLGVAPSFIVCKARGSQGTSSDWACYHVSLGATNRIWLNLTNATASNIVYWNNTAPTSSVFSLGTEGTVNTSGNTNVAYCWTPIAGYSAFGAYSGNASTDGPFIYTGFRPKFVMIKRYDVGAPWVMLDSSRNTYNVVNNYLFANASDAEASGSSPNDIDDFLSNGFKVRCSNAGQNASGGGYLYAAFAENPFKNSLAR